MAQGWDLIFVLGDPSYYGRFGFAAAVDHGLRLQWDVPAPAFMVRELHVGALSSVGGVARYHGAFDHV